MSLSELGNSGLGSTCQPRSRPAAKQLFESWPVDQLEPTGSPGYEGIGYPAAGYGQLRRRVVGLAQPKVADSVQLVANGWAEKEPVLNRVVRGIINKRSSDYTQARISVLAGLGDLGCPCNQVDKHMLANLHGVSLEDVDLRVIAQAIANGIVNRALPESLVSAIVDKIIADEKANVEAYNTIRVIRATDPTNRNIATLERQQQLAWGQTNTAKFYALLVPEMQKRLGFVDGKPRVSPPDYRYIKSGENAGVFDRAAMALRDKLIGNAAQQLLDAKYMVDSSAGLKGLGIVPVVIGVAVAVVVGAALAAYIVSRDSSSTQAATLAALTDLRASGKMSQVEFEKALAGIKGASANIGGGSDIGTIVKYVGFGLGALVLLQVLPVIRDAIPSRRG